MNTKLPYEDAMERRLGNVPLPAEEQSWQAMQQLLDKKEKRRLPAVLLYGRPILFALFIMSGLWLALRKNESTAIKQRLPEVTGNSTAANHKNVKKEYADTNAGTANPTPKKPAENVVSNKNYFEKNNTGFVKEKINTPPPLLSQLNNNGAKTNALLLRSPAKNENNEAANTAVKHEKRKINLALSPDKGSYNYSKKIKPENDLVNNKKRKQVDKTPSIKDVAAADQRNKNLVANLSSPKQLVVLNNKIKKENSGMPVTKLLLAKSNNAPLQIHDTIATAAGDKNNVTADVKANTPATAATILQNEIIKKGADSTRGKPAAPAIAAKPNDNKKEQKAAWSAGIGIQQQIPVGGQQIVSYGYNGTQNFIDNYIPSVYLRHEHQGRWFAQLEFGYGAPQPVKEFLYNRITKADASFTTITTTTLRLKKTYYHELPISFNYYFLRGWSAGAGGMYSILHKALSEQEVNVKNVAGQQEAVSYKIIPSSFNDSFLYKTQWHWLVQTAYEFKRFSFSLRYTRDTESYIKYTLPNGEINSKKNWSLEGIIRFRLWQPAKK